jgi:hypothetical protein
VGQEVVIRVKEIFFPDVQVVVNAHSDDDVGDFHVVVMVGVGHLVDPERFNRFFGVGIPQIVQEEHDWLLDVQEVDLSEIGEW